MRTPILCLYYWLVPMMDGVHAETIRPLFDLTRGSGRRISDYEFRTGTPYLNNPTMDSDARTILTVGIIAGRSFRVEIASFTSWSLWIAGPRNAAAFVWFG